MIGYKDMTWCPAKINEGCLKRGTCFRVMSQQERERAIKWWGGPDFPIAVFSQKPECYE